MKQSELLRKQADMMDMAEKYEIDDWRKLVCLWHNDEWVTLCVNSMTMHTTWSYRFALGVVEGKPVFEGDVLCDAFGNAHIAPNTNDGSPMVLAGATGWTWTPPKPKTVTVELLREDAEDLALDSPSSAIYRRIIQACRKALEEQK